MTLIDRTPVEAATSVRAYTWATVITTLATLATVLVLALTGNGDVAAIVAGAGGLGVVGAAVQITVHIRR
ncbi:hypothetical protein AB0N92_06355 [Streptomyces sp. NPDC093248]|uniref:hypothetical protein n=1 Tax=Streptomyces sp. NPDC093248 TaxID=3155072 RepID=UPI003437428B